MRPETIDPIMIFNFDLRPGTILTVTFLINGIKEHLPGHYDWKYNCEYDKYESSKGYRV